MPTLCINRTSLAKANKRKPESPTSPQATSEWCRVGHTERILIPRLQLSWPEGAGPRGSSISPQRRQTQTLLPVPRPIPSMLFAAPLCPLFRPVLLDRMVALEGSPPLGWDRGKRMEQGRNPGRARSLPSFHSLPGCPSCLHFNSVPIFQMRK